MFEWGDIRFLLAVARAGSTLAAAEIVGSSQSTVVRRIDALEAALGLKLFERRAQGYNLTSQGETLVELAKTAEAAMLAFGEAAEMAKRQLSGIIRFTLPPEGADPVLVGPIARFMERHPGVKVETIFTDSFLDVGAGEADVALRAGPRPTDPNLVVRKIGDVVWQGCCSLDYLKAFGAPKGWDDLAGHRIIGAEGQLAMAQPLRVLEELCDSFFLRAPTVRALTGLAMSGIGIAMLPRQAIMTMDQLVPCLPPVPGASSELWIITREDVRHTPHTRAFIDFFAAHMTALNISLGGIPDDWRNAAKLVG